MSPVEEQERAVRAAELHLQCVHRDFGELSQAAQTVMNAALTDLGSAHDAVTDGRCAMGDAVTDGHAVPCGFSFGHRPLAHRRNRFSTFFVVQ